MKKITQMVRVLTFRALALCQSESRYCWFHVVHLLENGGAKLLVRAWRKRSLLP